MSNDTCSEMLKVCAHRALRLDDDGTILESTTGEYDLTAPISFKYTPTSPARERFEVTDGCGNVCALFIGDPKAVDEVDLELHLCNLDAEVTELLCGGSVISDVSYGTYGYVAATDSTINVNGCAIETWAIQWSGRQRALLNGSPAWYHHVFPQTKWTVDPVTQENKFAEIVLKGTSQINSGFATGLTTDPIPVDLGDAAYCWFIDDAIISGTCGYVSTVDV